MYKKFLNAILFGALILGSAGTITSCKDYDDEIDEINQKLNTMTQKDELNAQIASLSSAISAAQSAASQAATEAANALAAAKEAAATASQAVSTATGASGQSGEAFAAAKDAAAAAETAAVNTAAAAKSAASAAAEAKKAAESGAGSAASAEKAQAAATAAQAAAAEASKNAAAATDAAQVSSKKAADAAASAAAAEGTAKEVQEAAAAAAAAQAALAQAAAADAKKAEASAQSAASEAANAAAQAAAAAGDAKAAAASADAAKKASEAADKAATASQAASAASAAEAKASAASSAAAKASAAAAQTDAAAAKASAAASAAKADEAAKKATEAAKSASDSAAAAASAKDDAAAAKQAATDSAKAAKDASDAATDAKNNADLAKAASEAAASSASDAAKEAKKAADDLQKALDSLEEVANTAAQKAAEDAKEAALKAIQSKLDDLQTEIDQKTDQSITEDMITEWNDKLDALKAEFSMKLGHRLTSLSVIPTTHVNGIAAITLTTLRYIPQEYLEWDEHGRGLQDGRFHDQNRPILDHIALGWDSEEDDERVAPVYISSEKNEAFYHVTPNNGVRKQDIKLPLFDNIISNNVTRADVDVVENSPLAPTDWDINNNILKVTFKKTTTEQIGSIGRPHRVQGGYLRAENDAENDVEQIALKRNEEKFYMVSLRAPIAEENLMEDENEAFVNSEYVRVEEIIKEPYIAHNKADFTKPIRADYFADETQATEDPEVGSNGRLFVHYHDSVCIYKSEVDEYVDILAAYNKELDLKKWVTVCLTDNFLDDHSTHEKLENYADYGLGFRFYIAEAPYITLGGPQNNSLRTDQQQFAEIKDAKKGIMTSKVYTIDGDPNQTSVGREPIVRVELWDEANGNLIAIRYIKVKWVLDLGKIEVPYTFDPGLFACGDYISIIGTEEMNTKIYSQIGENGMTKAIFHATYRDNGFTDDGSDYGTVSLRRNTENDVESYNIVWTLSHADIVSMIVKNYGTATWQWEAWKASGEPLKFTKTFYWKSSIAPSLEFTLTREIYPEDLDVFGYLQTYWRKNTDYSVFNVNPVVYNTQEPNPAWNIPQGANTNGGRNNPTNNIYTDLLNGFLDDLGVKPMTGADGVIYFTTTSDMQIGTNPYIYKAGKKYYYAEEYGLTDATTGAEGVSRKDDVYQWFYKEGVRFTFDEDKLNDDTHTYYYYDVVSGTYKKGYAYVVNNDGKSPELWISASKTDTQSFNQRAATIVNYEPNLRNAQELTYNIKLEEANPRHQPFAGPQPTEAAKALVGNYVPIKFVADLCEDGNEIHPEGASYPHTDVVKAYDAFIIEPLKPMVVDADAFTDATIGGSTIGVQGMNVYQSWNADAHGNYYPVMDGQIPGTAGEILGVWAGSGPRWAIHQYIRDEYIDKGYTEQEANEVAMLAYQLGRYYEATSVVWDTDNIKTNLKLEGGNLVADPDLKPADDLSNWSSLRSLPSNVTITYNGANQTLTYFNQDGTPVNINYNVFIPVTYGYKWKTMVGYVAVEVNSNAGTDDNQ